MNAGYIHGKSHLGSSIHTPVKMADSARDTYLSSAIAPRLPLRVLMLSQYPYVESDHTLGGIMQTTYQLVSGFVERDFPGIDLRLLSLNEGCTKPEWRRYGNVRVLHVPKSTSPFGFLLVEPFRLLYHLARTLITFRPHLLHAQGNVSFIMLSLLYGHRSIQTVHGIFRNEQKTVPLSQRSFGMQTRYWLREAFERFYLRKIQTLIVTSTQLVELAEKAGGNKRVVWINNSVDKAFFAGSEEPPRKGVRIMLFVGLITPRKGLHILLPAFRDIAAVNPDVQLRIVGITSAAEDYVYKLKAEYSELIEQGRVVFTGGVSQIALIEEYRSADMFVLPSLGETAPVAISQAMSIGLPVVSTRVGGIPDMIQEGETGIIVPPGDIQALHDALRSLIVDQGTLKSMRAASRVVAETRYHPAANAAKMLELYNTVMRNHSE